MSRSTALPASPDVGRAWPRFPLLYRALRAPLRGALERWFQLSVEGAEHLPHRGPYLVAANHHNYLDGVVLGVSVPAPIAFLVMPRVWRATPLPVRFGPPRRFSPTGGSARETRRDVTERIMADIAALLP